MVTRQNIENCTMNMPRKKDIKKPHFVSEERILRQYGEVYLSLAMSSTLWALTVQIYEQSLEFKNISQVFNNCLCNLLKTKSHTNCTAFYRLGTPRSNIFNADLGSTLETFVGNLRAVKYITNIQN